MRIAMTLLMSALIYWISKDNGRGNINVHSHSFARKLRKDNKLKLSNKFLNTQFKTSSKTKL
jgi:hypothetical protein